MKECCHGTKGCEGQGDKHWCADRSGMGRLESMERRIVVLEAAAHDHGGLSYVNGRFVAGELIEKTAGLGENKLTDADAKAMLEKLARHFGESVMPVGQYCVALNLWASALRDKAERLAAIAEPTEVEKDDAKAAVDFANAVGGVFMQITKSNLLHRLIYQCESLRTKMCPVHEGRWSGCAWPEKDKDCCACQGVQSGGFGSNVTGWLP
jgi:hypothetical protein